MSRPDPSEQSRSRRERILDAAFHAFATRGYRDTAVDDIAGAAETSKGGIYFHFPNKESIFRELMETTADKLVARVERAVALETEPVARAEAALHAVLTTFAGHRTMARLLFLDTMGAGRVFQAETNSLHERFARLIQGYLDEAVASGAIPPIDTRIASIAWFGALNEVVARWLLADHAGRLEDAYPALRAILLRSVGVDEARIARSSRCPPSPPARTSRRSRDDRGPAGQPTRGRRDAGAGSEPGGAARPSRWRGSGAGLGDGAGRRGRPDLALRGGGRGGPRGRAVAAPGRRDRAGRRRSRLGRPSPRDPTGSPTAERAWQGSLGRSRVDGREPRADGRARVHRPATRRRRRLGAVRRGIAGPAAAGLRAGR